MLASYGQRLGGLHALGWTSWISGKIWAPLKIEVGRLQLSWQDFCAKQQNHTSSTWQFFTSCDTCDSLQSHLLQLAGHILGGSICACPDWYHQGPEGFRCSSLWMLTHECLQGLSVQEIRDVLTKGRMLTQLSDLLGLSRAVSFMRSDVNSSNRSNECKVSGELWLVTKHNESEASVGSEWLGQESSCVL